MAQAGYTPILIYASGTTTNVPLAANLTSSSTGAELALNYFDGKLFYKDASGVVQVLASKNTGTAGGSNTQVQFNNSGALGGSANFTWSGTSLSVTGTVAVTGAVTATLDSTFSSTGALLISKGTTGQQPGSPVTGMLRYNTSTNQFEGYSGSSPSWNPVGGSSLSNDTSTASFEYPLFSSATSGTALTVYTSNAKLLYKPSTGEFQSSELIAGNGIVLNNATVSSSYTIATGNNAMSVGPVTVASGQTVTVSSGQRWVVL
jgi:hypothetical protein